MIRSLVLSALVVSMACTARADFITGVTQDGSGNMSIFGTPTITASDVFVTVDVNKMQQPFTLHFNTSASATTFYNFHVTMVNTLMGADAGKAFGPVRFALNALGGSTDFEDSNSNIPTSTINNHYALHPTDPGADSPTLINFGGLNGGGGSTASGDFTTFIFPVRVTTNATSKGGFDLTMTANPEPGSLALAGLIGIPGVIAARRRRKNVAASPVSVA